MATLFAMPKLGLNMVSGVVVRWLSAEGAPVNAGEAIVEVETDKAVQEVEAPGSGILARIMKRSGETVPCNGVIAVILDPGEEMPARIPEMIVEGVAPKVEVQVQVASAGSPAGQGVDAEASTPMRIPISPAARSLAKELGVDINKIVPRGTRIMREDVEAAYQVIQAKAAAPAATTQPGVSREPMSSVRRKIAEHLSQSTRSVSRVGLALEADASVLVAWREGLQEGGKKVSYNILLAKIAARALREFLYMNTRLDGDTICTFDEINIGVAVDAERGLLVPVLRRADEKSVVALLEEFDELAGRALQGRSKLEDLQGGTFTLSNLGSLEIESFLPVINYPECAILGVGAIVKKPVVVNDRFAIRPRIGLTLAFDHRLVDGAPAARFLQRIKHLVESPIV